MQQNLVTHYVPYAAWGIKLLSKNVPRIVAAATVPPSLPHELIGDCFTIHIFTSHKGNLCYVCN